MLKEKQSLPSAECEAAVDDGDHFRGPRERHAQMARHIICSFIGVDEVGRVFRHEMIKEAVQVCARRGICVLKDHQAGARVLNKHRGRAGTDAAGTHDLLAALRDLVGAFAVG